MGLNYIEEIIRLSRRLDNMQRVGTIYETTDPDFNPNNEWPGTWVKIEGKFLIGASDSTWNKLATEGQSFTLNTECICKWGIGDPQTATTFYQKTLPAGAYTANSTTFDGQDPASGTIKEVYVKLTFGTKQGKTNHVLDAYELPAHNHAYSYANRSSFTESGSTTTHYQHSGWSAVATTTAGASYSHTNMPPYQAIHIWERIA